MRFGRVKEPNPDRGDVDGAAIDELSLVVTVATALVSLTCHISDLPATAWHTVRLDREGAYGAQESSTRWPPCLPPTRPTTDHYRPGPRGPTVIITNDRVSTVKTLIERYARRMNIEQRLAESIRSFHTDALAGAVPNTFNLGLQLCSLSLWADRDGRY
jgi:hypothetical protein